MRYQTGRVLLLDLDNFRVCFFNKLVFRIWNLEVVNTNRGARFGRVLVTGVHQLVSKDTGLLQTNRAVALVNDLRDCLLNHRPVNHVVTKPFWNDVPQECTTNRCLDNARSRLCRFTVLNDFFVDTYFDARLKMYSTTCVSA